MADIPERQHHTCALASGAQLQGPYPGCQWLMDHGEHWTQKARAEEVAKLAQYAELVAILGDDPVERAKEAVDALRLLPLCREQLAMRGDSEVERRLAELSCGTLDMVLEQQKAWLATEKSLRAALAEKDAELSKERAEILELTTECDNLREALDNAWRSTPPHELVLHCPNCGKQHLDIGEFATRVHRKHLCENTTEGPGTGCGHLWVPHPYATKGVEFPVTQAAFAIGQERDALKAENARLQARADELTQKLEQSEKNKAYWELRCRDQLEPL